MNLPKEQYFRVFVPLEDNELAFHSDEEKVFRMRKGEVWFLDAAIIHAAINFSKNSRIFLCLDYAFPNEFSPEDIFTDRNMHNPEFKPFIVNREKVAENFEKDLIQPLSTLISKYTFKDIVFLLSKIHFYKDLPITSCYEWLVEIAAKSEDELILKKAKDLRKYLVENRALGEHFVMNQWPVPVKVK